MSVRDFSAAETQAVYRAIHERRDMRHFAGGEVAPDVLRRLLDAAHHAPSVGFMQPWRFIRVRDAALRQRLHATVEQERVLTARALGEREDEFMRLKVEGLLDAAELVAVTLSDRPKDVHVVLTGRRCPPEIIELADTVTEMTMVKHAFKAGIPAQRGIED